jgi:dimethylsulfoniopropionate demethylase
MCDARGRILNDPIVIKRDENRWWISLADSDIKLWAQGLAQGYGLQVDIFEPDVFPLAVQGPKSDELMSRLFGEAVKSIGFFRGKLLEFKGVPVYIARSGWSKQGGFEIYLHDTSLAEPLWDELFSLGKDLNVKAGCPNSIERMEAGLLSYGSDMNEFNNPFECGLDHYLDLDADIDSLSLPALVEMADKQTQKLVGMVFDQRMDFTEIANAEGGFNVSHDGQLIGEIRSQVWSPRYEKHLAFVMLERSYLCDNDSLEVCNQVGKLHAIPFEKEAFS